MVTKSPGPRVNPAAHPFVGELRLESGVTEVLDRQRTADGDKQVNTEVRMQLREEIHRDYRAQTVRDEDDRARFGKLIQNGTLCSPAAVWLVWYRRTGARNLTPS
jgi:hypothetical protein